MTVRRLLLCLALLYPVISAQADAPVSGYKIVMQYPHSTSSYTEGLFYLDGIFYEGTGLSGHSAVMSIFPETGKPILTHQLAPQLFGEGIVDWGPYLYEWTWQSHIGFIYDRATFKLVRQFTYDGEGWGMTHNTTSIITSDGSYTLRFRDPNTFKEVRHIDVHDGKNFITQLNELEWIKGEIYANIWHSDRIARISPADGHVIGWIDLTGILPASQRVDGEAVLNGIAYDAQHDRLFVTGKQWPAIFEIKIVPKKSK